MPHTEKSFVERNYCVLLFKCFGGLLATSVTPSSRISLSAHKNPNLNTHRVV